MFKMVKLLVLLAIVAGIVIGVYAYVRSFGDQAGSGPGKSGETVVPVEEKSGFTTETVEP